MTIEPSPRDLVEAATAAEELIERITVVQAIAMIALPAPHQAEPRGNERRDEREEAA
jgi:hypothetical protein